MNAQQKRTLDFLQSGLMLTPLSCWEELGISDPAEIVSQLRWRGFDIVERSLYVSNSWGENVLVPAWSLEE